MEGFFFKDSTGGDSKSKHEKEEKDRQRVKGKEISGIKEKKERGKDVKD
jgi:hypothetical protein